MSNLRAIIQDILSLTKLHKWHMIHVFYNESKCLRSKLCSIYYIMFILNFARVFNIYYIIFINIAREGDTHIHTIIRVKHINYSFIYIYTHTYTDMYIYTYTHIQTNI